MLAPKKVAVWRGGSLTLEGVASSAGCVELATEPNAADAADWVCWPASGPGVNKSTVPSTVVR